MRGKYKDSKFNYPTNICHLKKKIYAEENPNSRSLNVVHSTETTETETNSNRDL